MKKYIGTKQIEAEPMTRGDAWVPSISDMFADDWEIVLP